MHLVNLNDPNLLLGLWCGTIKVYPPDNVDLWTWRVLVGKIWQAHGKSVALATPFIPSSFGHAPRNPAEKINSGYKAWEFQIYLIGLSPALFRHTLPEEYWINYYKYVSGVRILQQWVVSPSDPSTGSQTALWVRTGVWAVVLSMSRWSDSLCPAEHSSLDSSCFGNNTHWPTSVLATLSGQSRRLLGTLEKKFARIVTHMRILPNEEFCMRS